MDKKIAPINWNTKKNVLQFDVHYNEKTDTLLAQGKIPIPAVSVDCGGEYWIRINPETGEIVGVEIEQFKRVFLKKHKKLFKEETTFIRPIADLIELEGCPA